MEEEIYSILIVGIMPNGELDGYLHLHKSDDIDRVRATAESAGQKLQQLKGFERVNIIIHTLDRDEFRLLLDDDDFTILAAEFLE